MKRNHLKFFAFVFLALLSGCGGGNGSGGTGRVKVSLTDAVACGFDEVNVTVSQVRIHQSASASEQMSGWHDIDISPPRKINLAALTNGVLEELGMAVLPAGHYTQLRLVLLPNSPGGAMNNSVTPTGGVETEMKTPSAVQSGLKLIHEFDVAANELVDLVLDFDACKSVVQKGNGSYGLKPVISVIPTVVSGAISGHVNSALTNAVIYAEQGGRVVKSTVPDPDGKFVLSPLQQSSTAGNYDVVVTADNASTAMIQSVPVTAQGNTSLSSQTEPIALTSSGVQTVSGSVTPAGAEAAVRATQTFSSGAVMEVGSISVSGSYLLTLPIGAPSLGSYGDGALPITLTADGAIAGKYQIEVSAEGFAVQTGPVIDITSGPVTDQDFNLSP
ncbi:MAG TPA: DUF4382 domain-containing protein [Candidatus Manganitrophaceae bacterium]|nr:DUF4382 domain-containing protein [Candidatus Manganitrophaceae bacterium]